MFWAVGALAVQVLVTRAGSGRDFSRPAGSPRRGLLYNFTVALLPGHKETARLHPLEFVLGILLHVGSLSSILGGILLVVWPVAGYGALTLARPLAVVTLLAGLWLLVRRIAWKTLRAISVPDDYLALLATIGLLAWTGAAPIGPRNEVGFLLYFGLVLLYFPLGKLRHAVFFFVARADYGRRLGYRGVYPPARAGKE